MTAPGVRSSGAPMGACASKAPAEHRADRALHLATRGKEGWGAPRGGEGTGRPAMTASARADAPTEPPARVDEKIDVQAGDSAPPAEEEAPAPVPAPATPMPATPPPVPHLTIVFVGLDGAGKTAVIRALADDGQRRKSAASTVDPDEGALCAPPTTVAVTIHAGLRACGVSIDVVDVPGGGIVAGNARHVAWRRHLDALKVTPAPKESAPREIAKRTTTMTEPVVEVDCVVFVVDSADDLRMAVARDELWRLCGLVPPGDDASGGIRTLDRAAPANTLADSTAMLVLANKSDVSGALAAGEVADALDLDQLRAELGAVGVRVIGCEACSAVDGGGIERALEGALRRER